MPALHQRRAARRTHQRDAAARARSGGDTAPVTGRPHDANRVVEYGIVDMYRCRSTLQHDDVFRCDNAVHPGHIEFFAYLISGNASHHADLFVVFRIVDTYLHQESVELCFGQCISAFLLDGILGGEHHERLL